MTDVRTAPEQQSAQGQPRGDFIWYELMTTDPDSAKDFYDAVVGWDIEPEPAGEMDYRMIRRSDGGNAGGVLRITPDMAGHGARPAWLGYLSVGDVDEAVASIERAGGKTWMGPTDIGNVGRIAMVTDPQSAPFYIMKPIPPANDPNAKSDVFSPSAEQRVGWNELSTSDPSAARSFYADQFGWGSEEFMPMGELGEYRFFDHHGQRIGALFRNPQGPARWRFYVRVKSISKAKAAAEAKGATISMGPHQVPTGEWVIGGTDPQGAEFALVGGE